MIAFTLPGRPTSWQRHIQFTDRKTGRIVSKSPAEMIAAQKVIKVVAKAAMRGSPPLVGALSLDVLCVYAIPRSWHPHKQQAARDGLVYKTSTPDHDNLVKQISDALNKVAYADDSQIVRVSFSKRFGEPQRTEVKLSILHGIFADSVHDREFKARALALAGQADLPLACNTQTDEEEQPR